MTRVMVIAGSVRPGRVALPIARWVSAELEAMEDVEVDLVDLGELALPLMDERHHPMVRQYEKPHTLAWSERVDEADAFVFVTPEYNHSYSPALKNALDFLSQEWRRKPVSFVSYGGVSAGTRAVVALKPVTAALGLVPTLASVEINFPRNFLSEAGEFVPSDTHRSRLEQAVTELVELSGALSVLRVAV